MSSIQQELDNLGNSPTLDDLDAAISRIWQDINGRSGLQSESFRRQRAAYSFLSRAAQQLNLPGLFTIPNGRYYIPAGDSGRAVAGADPRETQYLARVGLVPDAKREEYNRIFGNREGYGPLPTADTTLDRLPPLPQAVLVGDQVQTWNQSQWLEQNPQHFYIIIKDLLLSRPNPDNNREPITYRAPGRLFNASIDTLKDWAEANPRRIEDNKVYNQNEEQVYPEPEVAGGSAATSDEVAGGSARVNPEVVGTPAATPSPNLAAFAASGKGGLRNDRDETAAIRELQEFLQRLGLDIGAEEPDERYGPKTRQSVETFQQLVGFTGDALDGDAGPDTIAKIQEVITDLAEIERLTQEASRTTTNSSYDPVMKSFLGKLLYEELSTADQEKLQELLNKYETLLNGLPAEAPVRQVFTSAQTALSGVASGSSNAQPTAFTIDPNAQNSGAERNDRYRWTLDPRERTLAVEYFSNQGGNTRTLVRREYTDITYPVENPDVPENNLQGTRDGNTEFIQRQVMPNLYNALPNEIPVGLESSFNEWGEVTGNQLPEGWPEGYGLFKKSDEDEWYVQPPGDNEPRSENFDSVQDALAWANNHKNGETQPISAQTELSTAQRTRLTNPDTVLTAEDVASISAADLEAILTAHYGPAVELHNKITLTDSRLADVTLDTLYEAILLFEERLTGEEAVRLQRHIRNLMIIRNSPIYSQIEAGIRRDMEGLLSRVPAEFKSETTIDPQAYDQRATNSSGEETSQTPEYPLDANGLPVYEENFATDIRRLENFLLTQNPNSDKAFEATDGFMELHEKDVEEYRAMSNDEIDMRLREVRAVARNLSEGANIDLPSRQSIGSLLTDLEEEKRRRDADRSSTTSVSDNAQDIQAFVPNATDVFYQDSRRNEDILRVINDNNDDEMFVRQTRDGNYMLTDTEADGRTPVRITSDDLRRLNPTLHRQATSFFGDYQFGNDLQENMKLLLLTSQGRSPGLADQFLQSINLQSMSVSDRQDTLDSLRNLQQIMLGNVRPPIDVHPRALITHGGATSRVIGTFINDNSDVFVQPRDLPTDVPEAQVEKARTLYQAMSGAGVGRDEVTTTMLSIATSEEYNQVDRAFQAYSGGEALWDFIDSQWFFSTVRIERHLQSIGIQVINDSIRILDLTKKLLEKR